MKLTGIILLIIGIIMMVINGINWTTKEKVVDLGPIEVNKEKEHGVGWPVYAGGIVAAAGVVLIVAGVKKK